MRDWRANTHAAVRQMTVEQLEQGITWAWETPGPKSRECREHLSDGS